MLATMRCLLFWSPDEQCWAHVVLPWCRQTVQILQSLATPHSSSFYSSSRRQIFHAMLSRDNMTQESKLPLTDSFHHCSLYLCFSWYILISFFSDSVRNILCILLLLLQELVLDVAVVTSFRHADLSWARRNQTKLQPPSTVLHRCRFSNCPSFTTVQQNRPDTAI